MARPIFMADQCHTPSSHSTSESRKPPNAVENGAIAKVARVKSRIRNRLGSMNGLSDRRQCATNNASIAAAAAKLSMTAGAFQPHSFSFTIPNVSVGDAGGDQRGRPEIRCRNVVAGNPRELDPAHHQCEQPNRHVDQKNPPPTGRDEQSAYQRSQSGGEAADRGPDR